MYDRIEWLPHISATSLSLSLSLCSACSRRSPRPLNLSLPISFSSLLASLHAPRRLFLLLSFPVLSSIDRLIAFGPTNELTRSSVILSSFLLFSLPLRFSLPFDPSRYLLARSFSPRCLRLTLCPTGHYTVQQPPFVPAGRAPPIFGQRSPARECRMRGKPSFSIKFASGWWTFRRHFESSDPRGGVSRSERPKRTDSRSADDPSVVVPLAPAEGWQSRETRDESVTGLENRRVIFDVLSRLSG